MLSSAVGVMIVTDILKELQGFLEVLVLESLGLEDVAVDLNHVAQ